MNHRPHRHVFFRAMLLSIIAMSGSSLANPPADATQATTIKVSDRNVIDGLSPMNWVRTGDYVSAATGGASIKVAFRQTRSVSVRVDTGDIKFPEASRYPILAWSVNGGEPQTHQLAAGEAAIVLSKDVADPTIDLYLKAFSPFEDRYTGEVPPNAVKITGFAVDAGGVTTKASLPKKVWLNIGDSIMSGDAAAYATNQGRPPDGAWAASNDSRASYGYLLAKHYGYRESRIAYGGYDWNGGMAHIPDVGTLIDKITSTISRLNREQKLDPSPDVLLINLGENGTPGNEIVVASLTKLRSRVARTTKIIMMIPVSGKGRAQLTAAFNAYKDATKDKQAYLVDLGSITFATADGQHPTAEGHESICREAFPFFDKIVGPAPAGATAKPRN